MLWPERKNLTNLPVSLIRKDYSGVIEFFVVLYRVTKQTNKQKNYRIGQYNGSHVNKGQDTTEFVLESVGLEVTLRPSSLTPVVLVSSCPSTPEDSGRTSGTGRTAVVIG